MPIPPRREVRRRLDETLRGNRFSMILAAGGGTFRAALVLMEAYEVGEISAEELRRKTGMDYREILRHWYLRMVAAQRQELLRARQAGLITAGEYRAILGEGLGL